MVLTSSEPGALIPTIRSRVVAVRVPVLTPADVDAVLAEPAMQEAVKAMGGPLAAADQRRVAAGAPGLLLAEADWADAVARARRVLDAATSHDRREQARTSLAQGVSKSRGSFATSLDALTALLHERVRTSADRGNGPAARRAAQAMTVVERAKERATGNVNPQLITSELMRELGGLLR